MTTQTIDQARAAAFAGEVVGALNNAFSTLMISVGQRTGLFDVLATLPPSSSDAIAKAALFLLSESAAQITGQTLTVDGGWSVS